jgi:hypothetical protein
MIAGSPLRCGDRRTAPVIRSAVPVPSARLRDGAVPHRSRPEMQRSHQPSPRRYQLDGGHASPGGDQDPACRYPPAAGSGRRGDRCPSARRAASNIEPCHIRLPRRALRHADRQRRGPASGTGGLQAVRVEALARPYSPPQRSELAVAGGHAHEGDRRCSPASQSSVASPWPGSAS